MLDLYVFGYYLASFVIHQIIKIKGKLWDADLVYDFKCLQI